uniref:Ig-like domain-containing protein n=1 Tax=Leptobrachium leishanense TaxID=445787 RepID=A0A8C5MCJ1_9ANUR
MRSFCIAFLVLMSVSYVFSQTVTLDQPRSISLKPSETLKIPCNVSVSISSYFWPWVRQKAGSGLEYMGHIQSSGGKIYASSFQGRITVTRDVSKNEIYFEMPNMRNEDSGIYYCARGTR